MAKTIPNKKWIGLIAGGTGITPCYSIAAASLLANDGIDIKLVFSNKTKEDILCDSQLQGLKDINPVKFDYFHTLTDHNAEQDGSWDGL